MWPAMTEDPIPPGRGLPVYHPATVVEVGTCRVPCAVMPSLISLLCTPMAGMVRDTGAGTAADGDASGAGAADPEGRSASLRVAHAGLARAAAACQRPRGDGGAGAPSILDARRQHRSSPAG